MDTKREIILHGRLEWTSKGREFATVGWRSYGETLHDAYTEELGWTSRSRQTSLAAWRSYGPLPTTPRAGIHRALYPRVNPVSSTRKMCQIFLVKKCSADSLLVCPTPVCIGRHKNDHVRTLKILSEFGGLRKNEKTQHALC